MCFFCCVIVAIILLEEKNVIRIKLIFQFCIALEKFSFSCFISLPFFSFFLVTTLYLNDKKTVDSDLLIISNRNQFFFSDY